MDTADFFGVPPEPDPSKPKDEIGPLKPMQPGQSQPARSNRNRRRRNRRGPGGRPGQQQAGARHERQPRQNGQGNNRRRGAVFTGPMDHSYRQNGEGGNSLGGNLQNDGGNRFKHRGRFRQQFGKNRGPQQGFPAKQAQHFHSNIEPVPYREDAATRIFAFVDDLFFMTKIMDTAKKLNVKVEFVKSYDELIEKVGAEENIKPSLVIFDLNNVNAKPLATIAKLKAKFKKATSVLGFLSH